MTARAPRSYYDWHATVYKAGVSLPYLPAVPQCCRSLLEYRGDGQSHPVLFLGQLINYDRA